MTNTTGQIDETWVSHCPSWCTSGHDAARLVAVGDGVSHVLWTQSLPDKDGGKGYSVLLMVDAWENDGLLDAPTLTIEANGPTLTTGEARQLSTWLAEAADALDAQSGAQPR